MLNVKAGVRIVVAEQGVNLVAQIGRNIAHFSSAGSMGLAA